MLFALIIILGFFTVVILLNNFTRVPIIQEKIIYIDKPIETIIYVNKPIIQEKIIYVNKDINFNDAIKYIKNRMELKSIEEKTKGTYYRYNTFGDDKSYFYTEIIKE